MKFTNGFKVLTNEHGVTLIEAMVYTALAGMMLATAVTAFLGQNKSYNRQDVIAEIQQNLRGTTEQMASDIRFAGIGLHETSDEAFSIAAADYFSINYWSDLSEYWRPEVRGEKKTIHYRLDTDDNILKRAYTRIIDPYPADGDSVWEDLAENIDVIRFQYQIDNGDDPWTWQNSVDADDFEDIRAVKIMILGSSRESAFNQSVGGPFNFPITDDAPFSYTPASDSGYKRLMSTVVQTRNNRDN